MYSSPMFALGFLILLDAFFAVHAIIRVHIVCHSHDDVGWLKTVDQYYIGSNSSIQHASVQYILDSVVHQLSIDDTKRRTFIQVEQAFFTRWFKQQTPSLRDTVSALVTNRQIEFVNGGWCMHDEATAHYIDMIDQTTLGHKFIFENFNVRPTVGWQIDPFGHSSSQASVLSSQVGFSSLFFGRSDYQDRQLRTENRELEFVWRPNQEDLGSQNQIFAGAFQSGNYGSPSGLCFDVKCSGTPIQDDVRLDDVNVQSVVETFVTAANSYAANTKHLSDARESTDVNIMFTLGSDFHFEEAGQWYKNLDKLIDAVNRDGRVSAFYSTPSRYVESKYNEQRVWPLKKSGDDFFPYADRPKQFWTGYFTSRPAFKRHVRVCSGLLLAFRQVEAYAHVNGMQTPGWTSKLEEALALAQHHDAISGTAKQHVSDDYSRRLSLGVSSSFPIFSSVLSTLIGGGSPFLLQTCLALNVSVCACTVHARSFVTVLYNGIARQRTELVSVPTSFAQSSTFSFTVTDARSGFRVPAHVVPIILSAVNVADSAPYMIVFEAEVPPLGYASYVVQAKEEEDEKAEKKGESEGSGVEEEKKMEEQKMMMKTTTTTTTTTTSTTTNSAAAQDDVLSIANSFTRVNVSVSTGLLTSITDLMTGEILPISQQFLYYASYGSRNDEHENPSGAYIFRPNSSDAFPVSSSISARLIATGPVVWEIHQTAQSSSSSESSSPWFTCVIRLTASSPYPTFTYTVGPIPVMDDLIGKEVIVRFVTPLVTEGRVYTDSNAREFIMRTRDFRPSWTLNQTEPVSGNYYPVTSSAYLADVDGSRFVGVLVDRAQGAASLRDGQLEFMIHRRILQDDHRGVGEPLNETSSSTPYPYFRRLGVGLAVRVSHTLIYALTSSSGNRNVTLTKFFNVLRTHQHRLHVPIIPLFNPVITASSSPSSDFVSDFARNHRVYHSFLRANGNDVALPDSVELITLQSWLRSSSSSSISTTSSTAYSTPSSPCLIVRLAHSFQGSELSSAASAIDVDVGSLLSSFTMSSSSSLLVEEWSLTVNHLGSISNGSADRVFNTTEEYAPFIAKRGGVNGNIVTLTPMEIRTVKVAFNRS